MRMDHLKSNQSNMKESERIMKRIEQIKETMAPQHTSNHRSKWEQYLPADSSFPHYASLSKQENRWDNYRQSLEHRLQKLFREQKDLLRQRHYGPSVLTGSLSQANQRSQTNKEFRNSSIDKMERKIRQLQEKYRMKERDQHQPKLKEENWPIKIEERNLTSQNEEYPKAEEPKSRERTQSELVKSHGDQQARQARESVLQTEVEELKRSIAQVKKSNEQILAKMNQRQEKKKAKQRTKALLQAILHKLQFINAEINAAKKTAAKPSAKVEEAAELVQQFKYLKTQYVHLEQERKKVEERQQQIELKLRHLVEPN